MKFNDVSIPMNKIKLAKNWEKWSYWPDASGPKKRISNKTSQALSTSQNLRGNPQGGTGITVKNWFIAKV